MVFSVVRSNFNHINIAPYDSDESFNYDYIKYKNGDVSTFRNILDNNFNFMLVFFKIVILTTALLTVD